VKIKRKKLLTIVSLSCCLADTFPEMSETFLGYSWLECHVALFSLRCRAMNLFFRFLLPTIITKRIDTQKREKSTDEVTKSTDIKQRREK
jgi:hypothetical protein